jgi:hypothetical protein
MHGEMKEQPLTSINVAVAVAEELARRSYAVPRGFGRLLEKVSFRS